MDVERSVCVVDQVRREVDPIVLRSLMENTHGDTALPFVLPMHTRSELEFCPGPWLAAFPGRATRSVSLQVKISHRMFLPLRTAQQL